jgi:tetratricopeptide (TPR) repeat protein
MTRRRFLGAVFSSLLGFGMLGASLPAGASAAGGGGDSDDRSRLMSRAEDPDYSTAVKAIKAGQFPAAIRLLEGVVARDGKNPDAYNWLAYATRRNGNPSAAIPIYQKALTLDPKHRGAHEYIGEAYLTLDDLPNAKRHLARLDSLCFLPCEEYRDLKTAVEAYEKSGSKVKPTATR